MCPAPLEGVLERKGVEERRQHPRVIGGRAVHPLSRGGHASVDVPGTDHDRELDALLLDLDDLAGERVDPLAVERVLLVAHQRLA